MTKQQRAYAALITRREKHVVFQNSQQAQETTDIPVQVQENTKKLPIAVLRRSIFYLVLTIFAIELLFDAMFFGARIALSVFTLPTILIQIIATYSLSVFIVLSVIKAFFILLAAIAWVTTKFELYQGEIHFKYGILLRKEKIYMCEYAQEVTCTQSFLGRIFNFGTIELYSPVLEETVYIDSVPNPNKYIETIRQGIPKEHNAEFIPVKTQT